MSQEPRQKSISIFAPAKVNLYLHVLGKLSNGYHNLDSLVGFADIGDEIQLEPSTDFEFEISGHFASAFQAKDLNATPDSSNLVVKAVWGLSRLSGKAPNVKVTLVKNLPLGAGLGGGSADAAAVLWGLIDYWELSHNLDGLDALMVSLGADVPVCFKSQTTHVQGLGDQLFKAPDLPETPVVFVHPGKHCSTSKIFTMCGENFSQPVQLPPHFQTQEDLVIFLQKTDNALTARAINEIPEIRNILYILENENGCALSRMTGSGSACFGLFPSEDHAQNAAKNIQQENPDWWVYSGWLGRTNRY